MALYEYGCCVGCSEVLDLSLGYGRAPAYVWQVATARGSQWKWEQISMDFITKLSRTARGVDEIWVIVARLTKSAHFLTISESSYAERLVEIYVREVVSRNGVPISIVSDRDVCFTSRFWKKFHVELCTRLHFSTAYHPQTDEHSEWTIKTLQDMLRACVMDFGGS